MNRCWIGFGANQGHCRETFDEAWNRLGAHPHITLVARSGLYETAPVGRDAGQVFMNSVVMISTTLSPFDVLAHLQRIENDLGRVRTTRWGPRTLDLDVLFYAVQQIREPNLVVPHPSAWHRRFVLDPLLEISPDLLHTDWGITIRELCTALSHHPLQISIPSSTESRLRQHLAKLQSQFRNQFQWNEGGCDVPEIKLTVNSPDQTRPRIVSIPLQTGLGCDDTSLQSWTDFFTATLEIPRRLTDW